MSRFKIDVRLRSRRTLHLVEEALNRETAVMQASRYMAALGLNEFVMTYGCTKIDDLRPLIKLPSETEGTLLCNA